MLAGYRSIKQRAYMNLCQRWQLAGMFYPQTMPFAHGEGSASIEIIKAGKDLYNPVFDVFVDMPVKQEDKMQLEQACLASLQAAKAGAVGITLSDYIYIKELIAINNMRAAWVYLSYREKEIQEQKDAMSGQMQQINAQMQQEAEMIKQQMAAEREQQCKNTHWEWSAKRSAVGVSAGRAYQESSGRGWSSRSANSWSCSSGSGHWDSSGSWMQDPARALA
jgi:hypothetical protein